MGLSALEGLGGWPGLLARVVSGGALSADEAQAAMEDILAGEATPAQIAGMLVALRTRGETVEELSGMLAAMLGASERVPVDPAGLIDTCGTGGAPSRRRAAFNVSTIAAFVVAGAGGRVCKHGNRGASSTSGSFDLLEALGIRFDLGPEDVARCIAQAGIGACFAPRFHPAMRHAAPARRELGIPTAFNLLGPLANPARVRRQVIGVSDPGAAERMCRVLAAHGAEHVLVVRGHDGLDELSTTGPSTVVELRDGEVSTWLVDPVELGLPLAHLDDLAGGDAGANAELARRVLAGETGPHRDIVVLNAAAGLYVGGVVHDLAAGVDVAGAAVDDGSARAALDHLVRVSNEP